MIKTNYSLNVLKNLNFKKQSNKMDILFFSNQKYQSTIFPNLEKNKKNAIHFLPLDLGLSYLTYVLLVFRPFQIYL